MKPESGKIVAGKYRLEHPLAEGGMGAVWVAHHLGLEVDVAMKFMLGELADDPTVRQRFAREAKAAAKIKSPHITQIHDYGVHEGTPYMAMELLEGRDLDDVVMKREELGLDRVADIVTQLCRGLSIAHEAGVIHRDLKPSNVFLAEVGDQTIVKVLDFGIAKVVRSDLAVSKGTESGVLVGSPRYMSPEQATGEPLDGRSDLWSVGVLIYELLTGVSPFDSESLGKVITLICTADIAPPSHYDRRLGPEVDRFFERVFEREPARRYPTAMDLADAFEAAVRAEPKRARIDPLAQTDDMGAAAEDLGGTLDLPPETDPLPAATAGGRTPGMAAQTAPMMTPAPVSTDSRRVLGEDDDAPSPSPGRVLPALAVGLAA
ncbi:MAG: serine/threonine-protein kinase, partial [Polyangiaceae bacterium]